MIPACTANDNSQRPAALVSACIVGQRCRYDGGSKPMPAFVSGVSRHYRLVPICPERDGGLPTPRPAAWLAGGTAADVLAGRARVVNEAGDDVTEQFLNGAGAALQTARRTTASVAFLKENSPSCGVGRTRRDGSRVSGLGIATQLLLNNEVACVGVDDFRDDPGAAVQAARARATFAARPVTLHGPVGDSLGSHRQLDC